MAKEILIADPDKASQKEFERIFEATDYRLLLTNSDEEALLRGKLFKPDLIIGGKDLCQAVKADRELENIPFVILLDLFEDLSEMERKFLRADGMISRPLNEDEILGVVDHLGKGAGEKTGEAAFFHSKGSGRRTFDGIGATRTLREEEGFMHDLGEGEEELIELVDVVEEPESRMSIDDFALQERDEPIPELSPIEVWGKQEAKEEEKQAEEFSLKVEEVDTGKRAPGGDELFEKIEMEEILKKMERLQPSFDKEWPAEKDEKIRVETTPPHREAEDQYTGLKEFETALKAGVEAVPEEAEVQPFFTEAAAREELPSATPEEPSMEFELQELSEEEFPEFFLEELGEELERLEEKESRPEEAVAEAEPETTEEEELSELLELGVPPKEEIPLEPAPPEEIQEIEAEPPPLPIGVPRPSVEAAAPPAVRLDRKIEESLSKGMEEMLQDFVVRVLPEITGSIVSLTMERIEKTVREVVPDLAEKAIQDEIRRLQREDKE